MNGTQVSFLPWFPGENNACVNICNTVYVVPDHFTLNGKKHASLTLCCANSNPTQKANGVLFKQARVTQTALVNTPAFSHNFV